MMAASRLPAVGGAILAALGGGWFIAGNSVNMLWPHLGVPGVPAGTSATRVALEELGFFTGLGAVIVFIAALALGRWSVAATSGLPASIAGFPADPSSFPVRTDGAPGRPG
jgi:hypothetical protein